MSRSSVNLWLASLCAAAACLPSALRADQLMLNVPRLDSSAMKGMATPVPESPAIIPPKIGAIYLDTSKLLLQDFEKLSKDDLKARMELLKKFNDTLGDIQLQGAFAPTLPVGIDTPLSTPGATSGLDLYTGSGGGGTQTANASRPALSAPGDTVGFVNRTGGKFDFLLVIEGQSKLCSLEANSFRTYECGSQCGSGVTVSYNDGVKATTVTATGGKVLGITYGSGLWAVAAETN